MYDMNNWKHVFKLDPDKDISDDDLEKICESGTDAVIVGGTDQVTLENVLDLLSRIRRYTVPCVLEISNMESITPGFDFYFIPSVLNSRDRKWISGLHHEAIKEYGDVMNWDEIIMEGYCILNQEAKAFQYTAAELPEKEDVIAYARMAEKMFHFPIFYMEYSGTYGDPELVQAVKNVLKDTLLVYGGGIQSAKQAKEMSRYADIIVVGNAIYEDIQGALQTVQAVKQEQ
ncbi:putative glycerol-1-phosphate prenyltransferase [Melghiribacillus thermohalophilus]|uniref:Heptaprenylglyceryl phosphate synthase n=1 Tax=Melghiribacillus thermohalophilus TaxID=1324956 RepID=A0A4V2V0W8_9BACI|nr:heptaprenylglyceryl phosphate synthase [Melghiribacillus thermohalophilus]TCT18922.1 putative glycerol-1-phosphate prenyltransferase [Melghiribacillus thermohalophilus]